MVKIYAYVYLNNLGARMGACIHDEVLVQVIDSQDVPPDWGEVSYECGCVR